ncbi:MAG: prolyl oligopeptidase family serine peptidase, partial [Planctomycetota bacterium]
ADEQVTRSTPPTLLIHSYDDRVVSIKNPQRFAAACRANGVPVESHYYETGGHGYGMWPTEGSVAGWPAVLEQWLGAQGLKPTAE